MKTKIKICGIRNLESAQIAAENSADFLGFNFVTSSKRYIDSDKAKEIIEALRNKKYQTKMVGVFQDASPSEVNTIAKNLQLDFVQLHGQEDALYMKKINYKIIKKISADNPNFSSNKNIAYFLLDREIQGDGDMINLETAKKINRLLPIFFSGGLTPENVGQIIKQVKPFAVDVAGGIETEGRQDEEKIKKFIKVVKGVEL